MSVDVPQNVSCPCGNGYAEHRCTTVSNPGRRRRRLVHNYRHAGCDIGGAIVVERSFVSRRVGPLFQPGRYGIEAAAEGAGRPPLAADGGEQL